MTNHSRSAKEFLKRVYFTESMRKSGHTSYYPNTFLKRRVGAVKWLSEDRYQKVKKSLLEKEHLLIG